MHRSSSTSQQQVDDISAEADTGNYSLEEPEHTAAADVDRHDVSSSVAGSSTAAVPVDEW
jgi:hypothetical protein